MNKYYFQKILEKYLEGDASREQQIFIERYFDLFENEPGVLDTLSSREKINLKGSLKENVWSNISGGQPVAGKWRWNHSKFLRVAAAVVIMACLFLVAGYYLKKPSIKLTQVAVVKHTKVEPKRNRVIFLPDGSTVILNQGSKLNYPSTFDGLTRREVYLEGEAFFDIKHNKSRPFIVHTGKIQTKVLGTAFNVKAIRGEDNITVTVKRGKVSVNDENKVLGIITPNHQITYARSQVKSQMSEVDAEAVTTWKQEDLYIDDLTISEASKLIEDRYKVKIVISNAEVESLRFTTTFSKNETLSQTLNSICVFNDLVYSYDKEKSIVNIHP